MSTLIQPKYPVKVPAPRFPYVPTYPTSSISVVVNNYLQNGKIVEAYDAIMNAEVNQEISAQHFQVECIKLFNRTGPVLNVLPFDIQQFIIMQLIELLGYGYFDQCYKWLIQISQGQIFLEKEQAMRMF